MLKRMLRGILFLSFVSIAYAGTTYCNTLNANGPAGTFTNITSGCISNIFTPQENELSFLFLGMLFGSVGYNLSTATHAFISDMIYIFNMGVVCFSSVIVAYSTFLSTLSSAQDGSMLGAGSKGMGNAWVMLRTVIGISLQVPAFSGFSAVQVLIMSLVTESVNLASSIWGSVAVAQANAQTIMILPSDSTLQNTQQILTGVPSSLPTSPLSPNASPPAKSFIDTMYQSSLCWAANTAAYPAADCSTQCLQGSSYAQNCISGTSRTACSLQFSTSQTSTILTFPYQCGTYTFNFPFSQNATDPDGTQQERIQNQLQDIAALLTSQAYDQIIAAQSIIQSALLQGTYGSEPSSPNYIYKQLDTALGGCDAKDCPMARNYLSAASGYVQTASSILQATTAPSDNKAFWMLDAEKQGWLSAGMYYFIMASASKNTATTLSSMDGYTAQPNNPIPAAGPLSSLPNSTIASASVAWSYLTQFTLSNAILRDSSFQTICPATGTQSTACFAGTMAANSMANTTPTGEGSSFMDSLYRDFMYDAFSLMKTIDTYKYTDMLPDGAVGVGVIISPCSMIMPIARFGRLVAGSTIRIILGLHVDSWTTPDSDNVYTQCPFDGSMRSVTTTILKGSNNIPTCSTSLADACLSDKANCTAAQLESCFRGQYGMFPSMYAMSKGLYMDTIYSSSQMGIQLMAISINYFKTLISDSFQTSIDASWGLFGATVPLQIGSDIIAAASSGNDPIGSFIYALTQSAINVLKIFTEMSKSALDMYLPVGATINVCVLTLGTLLALYIPMIPLILFIQAVMHWLMSVIEAMVAGPLIIMGVINPEGHDLFGKSEQAIILLFGLFLRPSLIIFGLIFAMTLSFLAVQLLNYSFLVFFHEIVVFSLQYTPLTQSSLLLAAIIIYCYFYKQIIENAFSLISILPDKVLRWIGGAQDNSASAQMASQTKGQIQQVSGKAAEMGSGTASQGSHVGIQTASGSGQKSRPGDLDKNNKNETGSGGETPPPPPATPQGDNTNQAAPQDGGNPPPPPPPPPPPANNQTH